MPENKTAAGLVAHANRALKEKWWYVWGTFGQPLTQSLLDYKAKQYPTYNGGAYKATHQKHLGQTACDCVGLIKGYCMWDDKQGKPIYDSALDWNTGMLFDKATRRGPIATIPEEPGLCVYQKGHVGVYVGGGWVIECAGGKGAVKTPLTGPGATRWTHWFACPAVQYGSSAPANPGKEETPALPAAAFVQGDRVRLRPGAKAYNGGRLAGWMSGVTCTVLEPPQGDRVVIGQGETVLAAVRAQDLTLEKPQPAPRS